MAKFQYLQWEIPNYVSGKPTDEPPAPKYVLFYLTNAPGQECKESVKKNTTSNTEQSVDARSKS